MFKCRSADGRYNICGPNIKQQRLALPEKTSQRALAYSLQLHGLDIEKNAVQRIEAGKRFVTDIELKKIARVLGVTVDKLLSTEEDDEEKDDKAYGHCRQLPGRYTEGHYELHMS